MNVDKLILAALFAITVCRFILTGHSDLSPQESLWWMESQRLTWAYLDDGPALPALVRFSTFLLGDTPQAVRLWNPLFMLLSTYWLFLIARSVCNRTTARWSVVVFNLLPMVNFAAVRQLDVAACFCFTLLTLWLFWCGLHRARPGHWIWWLAGWSLALCVLIDFILALFALTPIFIITVIARWRRQWKRPGILVMLGIGLCLALAGVLRYGGWKFLVLYLQHHWLNLGFHPLESLLSLGKILLCTGPLLIVGGLWLRRCWHYYWADHGLQFLAIASFTPLTIAFLVSLILGEAVTLWWFGVAPALILVIHTWMQSDIPIETKVSWRRSVLIGTAACTLIGLQTDLVRSLGIPWPYAWDATQDQHTWRKSGLVLESALRQSHGRLGSAPFVITDSPETAAALDFYLPATTPVLQPDPNYPRVHVAESAGLEHQYHLWPNYSHSFEQTQQPFKGQTALYVTTSEDETLPLEIQHAFQSTEIASIVVIRRHHQTLKRWTFYHCKGYIGLPL